MTFTTQLLAVLLAFVYAFQVIFALIRLYEMNTMFQTWKNYKSRGEFWYMLLVPILPLLYSVYLKSKEIPK